MARRKDLPVLFVKLEIVLWIRGKLQSLLLLYVRSDPPALTSLQRKVID